MAVNHSGNLCAQNEVKDIYLLIAVHCIFPMFIIMFISPRFVVTSPPSTFVYPIVEQHVGKMLI